jgi:hypothetical protein
MNFFAPNASQPLIGLALNKFHLSGYWIWQVVKSKSNRIGNSKI